MKLSNIVFAIVCAVLLGVLSWKLLPPGFAWVASLVGAIAGYILYDLQGFVQSAATARENIRLKRGVVLLLTDVEQRYVRWKRLRRVTLRFYEHLLMSFGASFMVVRFSTDAETVDQLTQIQLFGWIAGTAAFVALFSLIVYSARHKTVEEMISKKFEISEPDYDAWLNEEVRKAKVSILKWNPIAAPFLLAGYLLWGVLELLWGIFKYTVSDGRISSAVGASCGVATAILMGGETVHVIIGLVTGLGVGIGLWAGNRVLVRAKAS